MQPLAKHSLSNVQEAQTLPSASHVRWAVNFVERRIDLAVACGNREHSQAFRKVLQVLHDIDCRTNSLRYRELTEAFDFLTMFTDDCMSAGSDAAALRSYLQLIQILSAVDIARKEEFESGQLCSQARVEELCGGQHVRTH